MVDFAEQRLNMVESQVRPSDLTDRRIATAMLEVPREIFLPKNLAGVAYSDGELSLVAINATPPARQVLAPATIAQMIQSLELEAEDVVLMVGAGCGYETALLSRMVQTVVALESNDDLAEWSDKVLAEDGISNAVVVRGPLEDGVAHEGPYDAILINGGVDTIRTGLLDQLKDGGRLVAIQRRGDVTRLCRWQRNGEHFAHNEHAAVTANILPAFANQPAFVF